jgi:hypothetical protein
MWLGLSPGLEPQQGASGLLYVVGELLAAEPFPRSPEGASLLNVPAAPSGPARAHRRLVV